MSSEQRKCKNGYSCNGACIPLDQVCRSGITLSSLEVESSRLITKESLQRKLDNLEEEFLSAGVTTFGIALASLWSAAFYLGQRTISSIIPNSFNKGYFEKEVLNKFFKDIRDKPVSEVPSSRLAVAAKTESTKAVNKGREYLFDKDPNITHVLFVSIEDRVTTDICRSRSGMVLKVGSAEYYANMPSLHYNCRSIYVPLYPNLDPSHKKLVEEARRKPSNRLLSPLPTGWKTS